MTPLEFETTEALVKELERRFDSIVIGFVKDHKSGERVHEIIWNGDLLECMGLALRIGLTVEHEGVQKKGENVDDSEDF